MSERILLTEMPKRIPRNGTFELTVRCNLHCKMCLFRHADCENAALIRKELTAAQWIDMARQAAEAGTMYLLITGGEPMLRPDFCEIWEGIYRQGFIIELYTNATMVTDKVMETLRKYPPHKIGITIYGASAETYEKVCGNGAAFERMRTGVKRLQTLPSELEFRATIIRDNAEDALAIDELARAEFGVKYGVQHASPINKAVRGACADVEACRLSPEEDMAMKAERLTDSFRRIIGPDFDPKNLRVVEKNAGIPEESTRPARFTLFGCQAGITQYTVTYNGKLLACQMIGAFEADAVEEGLREAWMRFPSLVHIPRTPVRCGDCEYTVNCQACYASRYAETGDFNGCSDYIYRAAKARSIYDVFIGGMNDGTCSLQ